MNELNDHGDGYEEYYYSKEREPVRDKTAREDKSEEGMLKLGYETQYVNFQTGCAQFFKHVSTEENYRINIDFASGKLSKIKFKKDSAGDMFPFDDNERYLLFMLMDEYDKWEEENKNDEL